MTWCQDGYDHVMGKRGGRHRIREGALTPFETPSNPPAATKLVPLVPSESPVGTPGKAYEVVLRREDDGGYSVFVPELPSVATQGETREEALEMAREAIEGYLEVMREDGLTVPRTERVTVTVSV